MTQHLILYDRAIQRNLDAGRTGREIADLLFKASAIIVSEDSLDDLNTNFPELVPSLLAKIRLYFNPWGKDTYSTSSRNYPVWQPGPREIGLPDWRTSRGVHLYRMNDMYTRNLLLLSWLWPKVRELDPAGVFLDDFDYDRWWWTGEGGWDQVKDRAWGPADGKPGWRAGRGWNKARMQDLENLAIAMVSEGLTAVVVNGSGRERAARLFEGFGEWITPDQLTDQIRAGDLVQVNGAIANQDLKMAAWATIDATDAQYGGYRIGTSFAEVWNDACAIAANVGASVGLGWNVRPGGHSLYTCMVNAENINA